uniref:Uncharacterized protein n=1 Tax=Eutreptiella gymnastica TaxID=73025 RepID=A0A7S1NPA3_9EUGL
MLTHRKAVWALYLRTAEVTQVRAELLAAQSQMQEVTAREAAEKGVLPGSRRSSSQSQGSRSGRAEDPIASSRALRSALAQAASEAKASESREVSRRRFAPPGVPQVAVPVQTLAFRGHDPKTPFRRRR